MIVTTQYPPRSGDEGMAVLDAVQERVFLDRYALKGSDGQPLERTPDDLWRRVARAIAAVEPTPALERTWAERFEAALRGFRFVPGGRILSGAGSGHKVSLFNCFVVPSPEDSRAGVLDNLKLVVEIMARGGGVGVNLSSLRPRGSYIRTVNGTSSGPCAWAELYSVATGDVIQQGGSRRGALMLMLDDWHPDIEEFITVKTDLRRLLHANLSVCISDAFMQAVKDDADWPLVWQGEVRKVVRARELWDRICTAAWRSAEPGLVFIDRVNTLNNLAYCETIRCCNPCGEEPLAPFNVCNLGALNLAAFVRDGQLDARALSETTRVAVRFLDNVIDATPYFLPENEGAQKGVRRVGLGTMGLADALIALGVRYGSDESLVAIEEIYRTIRDAAYDASADLAAEKGPFPKFDRDWFLDRPFIRRLPEPIRAKIAAHGIRNGTLLCQAPTGTTSLLAGVSSGIEPVFDFRLVRRDRLGEHVIEHPAYRAWRQAHPSTPLPPSFVTAGELTPEEHVRVQAKIQEYTDASISKTTNAPKTHTVDEVQRLYQLAYELGCKGITYYRDGSRPAVLSHAEGAQPTANGLVRRPRALEGTTYRTETPLGTAFVTVNTREGAEGREPFEVFLNVGKAGSDIAALAEAIGRLCSLCLRLPCQLPARERVAAIVHQLGGSVAGARSASAPGGCARCPMRWPACSPRRPSSTTRWLPTRGHQRPARATSARPAARPHWPIARAAGAAPAGSALAEPAEDREGALARHRASPSTRVWRRSIRWARALALQVAPLRAYAQARSWPVAPEHVYRDEGVSGLQLERLGLDRLRMAIARGRIDVVRVSTPDRLARDDTALSQLLDEWVRASCRVVFTDQG
ncbi:MAG TPA: adenosylcobalamin-dependent ribonucleoside-diphosphate reductase [Chloroflexota bacterium]|nr:adenosylcobalamin-dependent ribonucleoside-diphosphate reductase [Chloroflexota bacterium]